MSYAPTASNPDSIGQSQQLPGDPQGLLDPLIGGNVQGHAAQPLQVASIPYPNYYDPQQHTPTYNSPDASNQDPQGVPYVGTTTSSSNPGVPGMTSNFDMGKNSGVIPQYGWANSNTSPAGNTLPTNPPHSTSNHNPATSHQQAFPTFDQPMSIYAEVTHDLRTALQDRSKFTAPFYIKGLSSCNWKRHPTELHWKFGDPSFVDLPLSSAFRMTSDNTPKWMKIQEKLVQLKSLFQHIQNTKAYNQVNVGKEMGSCIQGYQAGMAGDCNFRILNNRELSYSLIFAIPRIVDRCLELDSLLAYPLPKLVTGRQHTLLLTRRLCCSLLANAFFGTIPYHNRDTNQIQHFHFLKLFHEGDEGAERSAVKVEKIKCVLEYIAYLSDKIDRNQDPDLLDSIISFERRYYTQKKNWAKSYKPLCHVAINEKGVIEDASGLLQVDFANKYIGGGILSRGMVQEEIRFATCPDLIVSRLFTEVLGHDEVLVVTGAKQFTEYSGYRTTFKMKRMQQPQFLHRDNLGREMVHLVAMDALHFQQGSEWVQYQQQQMNRELHKASIAFYQGSGAPQEVATGNWGCGAFNGDAQFKMLLQWMAASEAGRPGMVYFTIGDQKFTGEIRDILRHVLQKQISVGQMYKVLERYEHAAKSKGHGRITVFEFVKRSL